MTVSQRALALVREEIPFGASTQAAGRRTPIFIIASPRRLSGKTFLARLVTDFLRSDGAAVAAFDLNPSEGALADYLPAVTTRAELGTTRAQMALFDRLIVDDGVAKVIDVGHVSYAPFFTVCEEIRFIDEARRRTLEAILLFPAEAHPAAVEAYADLRRRFPANVVLAVFNEAITKGQKFRDKYPFTRAATVPLQIPVLAPGLRAVAEGSGHSFADFYEQLPLSVPIGHAFELRSWTRRVFLEFREFELRLLMEKLRASLR